VHVGLLKTNGFWLQKKQNASQITRSALTMHILAKLEKVVKTAGHWPITALN